MPDPFVFAAGRALPLLHTPPDAAPQIACPTCGFLLILNPISHSLECLGCGWDLRLTPAESARLSDFLGFRLRLVGPTVADRAALAQPQVRPVRSRWRVWRLLLRTALPTLLRRLASAFS